MPEYSEDKMFEDLSTAQKFDLLFDNFRDFIKEKNRRYGDSALAPMKVFSSKDSLDQIANRIDDKLSRIRTSVENGEKPKKNDVCDLFGYVSLYMARENWLTFDEFLD